MTSEGLGEMFEGDSADTGAGKFPLVSMGGRVEGLACADSGARTPIDASGILSSTRKTNKSDNTLAPTTLQLMVQALFSKTFSYAASR